MPGSTAAAPISCVHPAWVAPGVGTAARRVRRPDFQGDRHLDPPRARNRDPLGAPLPLRTAAELSLGLSFAVTTAFGGYSAATGQLAVVSQVAGIVFVVTLMCVLVSWFRAVDHEESHSPRALAGHRRRRPRPQAPGRGRTGGLCRVGRTHIGGRRPAHPLSVIDAEYRR